MKKTLLLVLISVLLFSTPWLLGGIFSWAVCGAFVPLLILRSCATRGFLWWALLTFALWIMATCWWVGVATPVALVAVPVVGLCFMFVPFAIWHRISRNTPEPLTWVMLVTMWITAEAAYMYGQISFPWLTLGHAFADVPWGVQWYSITGVFGGSLLILISNILIFKMIQKRAWRGVWMWLVVAVLIVPLIASLISYFTYSENVDPVNITVVQPNIDPYSEKFGSMSDKQQRNLILSLAAMAPGDANFIVAPETSLNDNIWLDKLSNDAALDTIRHFMAARYPDATMVVGATTLRRQNENELSDYETYTQMGTRFKVYNSALWVDSSAWVDVYHKSKLVVGPETVPYPAIFGAVGNFINVDLGGMGGRNGRSQRREVFKNSGTAICYESIYGEFFTEYIHAGASVMFIITNDGWWGDTPGYRGLLNFARLRAVETRRSIGRSANTGVSAMINQRGEITDSLGWDKCGVISGTLNANDYQTFYVRAGDYIVRLCMYILALALLYRIALAYRRRI